MKGLTTALVCLVMLGAWPLLAQETEPAQSSPPSGQAVRATSATEDEGIPAQRVVVMDMEYSGRYSHELRKWLPALIEAKLAESGWAVLARGEAMQAIQREQNLRGVNPTTTPPKDKLYGASALLKLNARAEVKDYDAAAHIGIFSIGGLTKVKFHLNGQIIDTGTGVIRPLGEITTSKSKLKRLAIVFPKIGYIGGGYNVGGIRESLVGSAADEAAGQLVKRLEAMPDNVPGYEASIPVDQETIVLSFPKGMRPAPGAEYGIYRRDRMIAKVRVVNFSEGRATCRILSATDQIRSTDVARPLEVVVPVEIGTE